MSTEARRASVPPRPDGPPRPAQPPTAGAGHEEQPTAAPGEKPANDTAQPSGAGENGTHGVAGPRDGAARPGPPRVPSSWVRPYAPSVDEEPSGPASAPGGTAPSDRTLRFSAPFGPGPADTPPPPPASARFPDAPPRRPGTPRNGSAPYRPPGTEAPRTAHPDHPRGTTTPPAAPGPAPRPAPAAGPGAGPRPAATPAGRPGGAPTDDRADRTTELRFGGPAATRAPEPTEAGGAPTPAPPTPRSSDFFGPRPGTTAPRSAEPADRSGSRPTAPASGSAWSPLPRSWVPSPSAAVDQETGQGPGSARRAAAAQPPAGEPDDQPAWTPTSAIPPPDFTLPPRAPRQPTTRPAAATPAPPTRPTPAPGAAPRPTTATGDPAAPASDLSGSGAAPRPASGPEASGGRPASAPGTSGRAASAPGTSGRAASAPGTSGRAASAPGVPGRPASPPGASGRPASAPGVPGRPPTDPVDSSARPVPAAGAPGRPVSESGASGRPAGGSSVPGRSSAESDASARTSLLGEFDDAEPGPSTRRTPTPAPPPDTPPRPTAAPPRPAAAPNTPPRPTVAPDPFAAHSAKAGAATPRPSEPPLPGGVSPDPALSWSAPMAPGKAPGATRPVVTFARPEGFGDAGRGAGRRGRTLVAAACVVLGLGLIGGAVTGSWLIGDAEGSGARDTYAAAGGLWHNVPVDDLFPVTVDGQGAGPGGADRTWTRIAVAPDSGCADAFDPLLRQALTPVGCQRLLRATYTDATQSYVTTVGLLFTTADAAGMRALDTRFDKEGLARRTDLMPKPYAAKGTAAASFGDRQRAAWTVSVLTDAPVVVYAVSGWADGRTVDSPEPAAQATASGSTAAPAQAGLGNEAQGLADRIERSLRKTAVTPPSEQPS
ncbi:hypothetical protein U5640_36065 [Streptomyces sp. SS7]|uniref:hypothetical protein n=1 Tax=Streptomyces sp. SS7 TaxID=3108485 RepID=UPI0030EBA505